MFDDAYHFLLWPMTRSWFSDASGSAVGHFCMETGQWWRYGLTGEQRQHVRRHEIHSENDISVNVLKLLGMVTSA